MPRPRIFAPKHSHFDQIYGSLNDNNESTNNNNNNINKFNITILEDPAILAEFNYDSTTDNNSLNPRHCLQQTVKNYADRALDFDRWSDAPENSHGAHVLRMTFLKELVRGRGSGHGGCGTGSYFNACRGSLAAEVVKEMG